MTMEYGTILLVVGNPDDELLTRRTLRKNDICNDVVVARDGAEALASSHGPPPLLGRSTPPIKKGPPNGFRLGHNPLL